MPDASWWGLQGATVLTLVACAALAFTASGRVGRHTPYGTFLFVITLGFWFVTVGIITYVSTRGLGAWSGPPGWGDPLMIAGWMLLTVSFHLLLLRFPAPGSKPTTHRAIVAVLPVLVGFLFASMVVWRNLHLSRPLDAEAGTRMAFLFLDGVAVGAVALAVPLLRRIGRASVVLLFAFLGAALLVKTVGDILYLIWPTGAPHLGVATTALYPLGGALALLGLYLHNRAVMPLAERRVLAHPGFASGQLVLRDAARRMRGLAGKMGEELVLDAGRDALAARGVPAKIQNGILHADTDPASWQRAVRAAEGRTAAVLGEPGATLFAQVLDAYQQRLEDPGGDGPS